MLTWTLAIILMTAPLALAAPPCANLGKLCDSDGSTNAPDCCGAQTSPPTAYCPQVGSNKNHCTVLTSTPTTPPSTSPPTSAPTTHPPEQPPPSTPPTTMPPLSPIRWNYQSVGLAVLRDSQNILYHPTTGAPLTQTAAWARLQTLHWVAMPDVDLAFANIPSCQSQLDFAIDILAVVPGKFWGNYVLRPMECPGQPAPCGQPYPVHPNYLEDTPKNVMDKLQRCILADPVANAASPVLTPDMLDLVDLRVSGGRVVEAGWQPAAKCSTCDHSHENDGLLDPKKPGKPLTSKQCTALQAAEDAHEVHDQALLDDDAAKEKATAPAVQQKQLAFEQTMTDSPIHLTEATLIFAGKVGAPQTSSDVKRRTREIMHYHHIWSAGFNCASHAPPDLREIQRGLYGHNSFHFARAVALPGIRMKEACPLPHNNDCLIKDM